MFLNVINSKFWLLIFIRYFTIIVSIKLKKYINILSNHLVDKFNIIIMSYYLCIMFFMLITIPSMTLIQPL